MQRYATAPFYIESTRLRQRVLQVYISSRSAKDCDETAKELTAMGPGKCIPIPADMQKLSEVERLVAELSRKESKLHVLVNNAGATWGATFEEYPVSILLAYKRHSCL